MVSDSYWNPEFWDGVRAVKPEEIGTVSVWTPFPGIRLRVTQRDDVLRLEVWVKTGPNRWAYEVMDPGPPMKSLGGGGVNIW